MKQDINFLSALPKEPNYLPAKWILAGLTFLVILFFAMSVTRSIQIHQQEKQLKESAQQKMEAAQAFQLIAKNYPMLATDKPFVDQVTDFAQQLEEKKAHFKEITHATIRQPFSSYMKTLSDVVPEGLWLTAFTINQDSESISLRGFSLQPLYVSVLLQKLQTSSIFKDIYFDLFYVKNIKDKNYIKFEVANNQLLEPPQEDEEKSTPIVESGSVEKTAPKSP